METKEKSVYYTHREEWGISYVNFRTIPEAVDFLKELKKEVPKVKISENDRNWLETISKKYYKRKILGIPSKFGPKWYEFYNMEYKCDFTAEDYHTNDLKDIISKVANKLGYYMIYIDIENGQFGYNYVLKIDKPNE